MDFVLFLSVGVALQLLSFHLATGALLALTSQTIHARLLPNGSHQPDFLTLRDDLSILELYQVEKKMNLTESVALNEADKNMVSVCGNNEKTSALKTRVLQGIERTLKFYGAHMDMLPPVSDPSVGLSFLRGVDNKHGKQFQTVYPISDWITRICNQTTFGGEKEFCMESSKKWKPRAGQSWKSEDVITFNNNGSTELIGKEKEHIWGKLNGECQLAIVNRCEVPYICERTLYDPVPRSMYFLTHQALQRILTEQSDCTSAKQLLNEQVNDELCSKMYQEASLISKLDYPHVLRDLFSEFVAICGYMRYPNFFREDWVETILSWQSRSEYGCFTDDNYNGAFVSSDNPIVRRKTNGEIAKGEVSQEGELCLPHFTTVALSALAMSWDYIEENCEN